MTTLHIPYVDDWAGPRRFYCDCDEATETYYVTLDDWFLHWHAGETGSDITGQLAVERSQQEQRDAAESRMAAALATLAPIYALGYVPVGGYDLIEKAYRILAAHDALTGDA